MGCTTRATCPVCQLLQMPGSGRNNRSGSEQCAGQGHEIVCFLDGLTAFLAQYLRTKLAVHCDASSGS